VGEGLYEATLIDVIRIGERAIQIKHHQFHNGLKYFTAHRKALASLPTGCGCRASTSGRRCAINFSASSEVYVCWIASSKVGSLGLAEDFIAHCMQIGHVLHLLRIAAEPPMQEPLIPNVFLRRHTADVVRTRTISPDDHASLVATKPDRLSSSAISAGTFGACPSGHEGCGRRSSIM